MLFKKQQLEPDMEEWTGSKLGKEYAKAIYCCPVYLFNLYAEYIMRNAVMDEAQARFKISGRNINNLRYADDNTIIAEVIEGLKSLLMKMKEDSEKDGLKLNFQKMKIMASGPIMSWQIDREMKQWKTLFSWTEESLQMVTSAKKLTDVCSLEEKLWQTQYVCV